LTTLVGYGAKQSKKSTEPEPLLAHAPASAAQLANPYANQPKAAVMAGKNLYQRYCAQCHGSDGSGRGKALDLHSSTIQQVAPGTLFWYLKNGNLKAGMPAWSSLPDQQLWQLVTFLKTTK
jgi:mono/diheme cytochrome c family protein